MKHKILIKREKSGLGHPFAALYVKEAINKALKFENVNCKCELSVLFTDETGIRNINREFRNTDKSTDVLSFPMNDLVPENFIPDQCEINHDNGNVILGDIVLSLPQCKSQGKEFGHGFSRELKYLTVHSVLHLLGYDHIDEAEMKKQMRRREKQIMGEE